MIRRLCERVARLRMIRVTYRGKPLNHPLTILSNKRRPLPPYATAFCEMLAEYVREVFPITRPSAPDGASRGEGADQVGRE